MQVVSKEQAERIKKSAAVQLDEERRLANEGLAKKRATAQAAVAEAERALAWQTEKRQAEEAGIVAYETERARAKERTAALAALGPKPTVDPEPTGAPATPAVGEPTAEEVTRARALLSRATQAAADLRTYEARTVTLSEDIEHAANALKLREAELARARAVEAAHKGAPARAGSGGLPTCRSVWTMRRRGAAATTRARARCSGCSPSRAKSRARPPSPRIGSGSNYFPAGWVRLVA